MRGWGFLALAAWGLVAWIAWSRIRAVVKMPPSQRPDHDCGGLAAGCPVCLAAAVAAGVIVGEWLDGD
ncbi:MAG: hypothetical protein F4089_07165 [Gammaproteobacteria bacterium]|nr:hypothetical protein [Acidobacteriota bacterium]MYA15256.1 hypothetical protein [Gammaproteobacteria bacterium]MYJ74882.1 hypothetical protein [Gammaproteobacteria bacterium]